MWDSYRVAEAGVCMFCIVWLTLDPSRHKQSQTNQRAEEMKWNKTSICLHQVISIIVRCIFSFLFIDRELTTWSASNCVLISVLLQVIFCSCIIETTLLCENGRSDQAESDWTYLVDTKNGDRMIKQLSNSVIAKYRDLSVSRRSIICLSLRLRQITDLLATDKWRYFAQPRSIIVNYFAEGNKYWFVKKLLWFSLSSNLYFIPLLLSTLISHYADLAR